MQKISEIKPIEHIITNYDSYIGISINYSAYSEVFCENPIYVLFLLALTDYSVIYKNSEMIIKLNNILTTEKIFDEPTEDNINEIIKRVYHYVCQSKNIGNVKEQLHRYRNEVHIYFDSFQNAIKKLAWIRGKKSENYNEVRILHESLFIKNEYDFQSLKPLIEYLKISVKLIDLDNSEVEDINPYLDQVFSFLKYKENWYILYKKEDYLLYNSSDQDYESVFSAIKNLEKAKSAKENEAKQEINNEIQTFNDASATLKVLLQYLYPNRSVYDLEEDLENKDLSEIFKHDYCKHCFIITNERSRCGHPICEEYRKRVNFAPTKCPTCSEYL